MTKYGRLTDADFQLDYSPHLKVDQRYSSDYLARRAALEERIARTAGVVVKDSVGVPRRQLPRRRLKETRGE